MTRFDEIRSYSYLAVRMLVFALFMVHVPGSARAQEIVKGTFTLDEGTRFGTTLLPAGHYTMFIAPVTSLTAPGSRVSVFIRPESKSGPVASVFALASQRACDAGSGLTLLSDGRGLVARSLCLEKQGLLVDFDSSRSAETPRFKTPMTTTQP
jgi:hypothetical protein